MVLSILMVLKFADGAVIIVLLKFTAGAVIIMPLKERSLVRTGRPFKRLRPVWSLCRPDISQQRVIGNLTVLISRSLLHLADGSTLVN